jgi:DNA-binding phage protein
MARRPKTAFDRYFERRMRDPAFAAEYRQARAEIDATDTLIRALEQARERTGMTKAGLARRINSKPEIVRRLLTMADGNPTMGTVLKVATALGYHLELVPNPRTTGRRTVARTEAARKRKIG